MSPHTERVAVQGVHYHYLLQGCDELVDRETADSPEQETAKQIRRTVFASYFDGQDTAGFERVEWYTPGRYHQIIAAGEYSFPALAEKIMLEVWTRAVFLEIENLENIQPPAGAMNFDVPEEYRQAFQYFMAAVADVMRKGVAKGYTAGLSRFIATGFRTASPQYWQPCETVAKTIRGVQKLEAKNYRGAFEDWVKGAAALMTSFHNFIFEHMHCSPYDFDG